MKIKKNDLLFLIILSALIVLAIFVFINYETTARKVCFPSIQKCVEVEIADDYNERQIGLMYREYLDENSGMLFIFGEEGFYPFWMKNTLIPLDMIWISQDVKIIDIQSAVPCEQEPCEIYSPSGRALYVLEVNSDWAERNGVEIGDEVEFE